MIEHQVDVLVVVRLEHIQEADDVLVAAQLLLGVRNGTQTQLGRACRYIISRNVRCASISLRNASKFFFSATMPPLFLSTAFHTMP